jgi:hypothetical protein
MLVFGYDLGDMPEFVGLDSDVESPIWWIDDDEDEDSPDFGTAAHRRLLDVSGFIERWSEGVDGYFEREEAASEALGVEVLQHGSDEAPQWLLVAKSFTAGWGDPEVVRLPDLAHGIGQWEQRLVWAVDALGLQLPEDAHQPEWLLAAYSDAD